MNSKKRSDVAIVGIACQFPGADNADFYWQNLVARKNSIKEIPAERWDVSAHYSAQKNQLNKSISKWCGLIDDIQNFDNEFFNISPIEARNMDPQQRLLLQESWHCIEDSAIPLSTLQQAKTSVFVGAMTSDYLQTLNKSQDANNRYSILGNDHCILANRISHQFNFRGESISINAASASSLVAIHKAKSSLVMGECDYAIAAGVNLNTDPFKYIVFSQAGMLSPDGQCKSFSDDANGYVPGDGVAALLLQPLEQAIESKNHIYAVLKGSAINHTGSGQSITAPCASAQAEVISDALHNAEKCVSEVGYIEAHGSGTPLGDPVEIEAINRVFKHSESDVIIGTVKPNIGHLEAAAGIAGVIKALYVLKHQYVPANLNLNNINPALNMSSQKIKLASGELLNTFDQPCVGVSAFGFGGVSCHLILERFKDPADQTDISALKHKEHHFLLSAQTESSLKNSVKNWQQFLQSPESSHAYIHDICASVATGRQQFPYRIGCIVSDKEQLFKQLKHIEIKNDTGSDLRSYVFADNRDSTLRSKVPLINKNYLELLHQVQSSEQYDDTKASSIFRSTDFKSTLLSVAVFNALQDIHATPTLVEQIGHSVWSALLSVESVSLDDYLAVVLHNRKLSDVEFHHPKYPIKISHKSKTLYPEYLNINFMKRFFNEVKTQQKNYQNIIDQAKTLLISDQNFIDIFSIWNYGNDSNNDLNHVLNHFPKVVDDDIQKASFAIVAANVSLNRFYKKWKFECSDSQNCYYITLLSGLISKKILSQANFFKISQKVLAVESDAIMVDLNRRHWRTINQLVCDIEKRQHRKVIKHAAPIISAIESKVAQLSKNPRNISRTSIGQVKNVDQIKVDQQIYEIEQWQQSLLTFWLQGSHLNWYKVYPYKSFYSCSLPVYSFDKYDFWTTIVQPKSIKVADNDDDQPIAHSENEQEKSLTTVSHLEQTILKIFAAQISSDLEKINIHKNLEAYGLDSMAHTALSEQLNQKFSTTITPADFYGFKNINELINEINRQVPVSEIKKAAQKPKKQPTDRKKNVQQEEPEQLKHQPSDHEDVAIIGYAGQLPNADSLEHFWTNIMSGVDCISAIPTSRWDWRKHFSSDISEVNKSPSKWGGFISDIACFDAAFFGVSPQEAKLMDPQQRILLQTVWHAIEMSGHQPASLAGTDTGVFIGASTSDYEELIREHSLAAHASTGMNRSIIANRVSFVLDLLGPSEVIDTACSSSLVAIHKAVQAIKSGECRMALAGGVNALITPTHYISYGKAGMLSPDGKCKTFDKDANGYVRGEGVGVVVLKALSEAIKDNDVIHAVIKASGTNHGGKASSLTAPNPNAQAQLIFDTYRNAGVESHSIDYIENHGTGTPLGDPIEINGIALAFQKLAAMESSTDSPPGVCKLASVKSNIGHLEAAAGIAGVLKVILALKHQYLPASQNITELNPYVKLDSDRFEILQENKPWPSKPDFRLRRAGVSSFGFGGVNGHLVLEEFIREKKPATRAASIFVLSGKTRRALNEYVKNYLDFFNDHDNDACIQSIAYTSQVGRNPEKFRLAICAFDIQELIEGLQSFNVGKKSTKLFSGEINAEQSQSMFDEKLSVLWEKGAHSTLAKIWVKGLNISWHQFYKANSIQRTVLPVYPFAKKAHWLSEEKNISGVQKDKNNISIQDKAVEKTDVAIEIKPYNHQVPKSHYLTTEHKVNELCISPGVFSLELIYKAIEKAGLPINQVVLSNVFWQAPIVFDGKDKLLSVINQINNKGYQFEIIHAVNDSTSEQNKALTLATCQLNRALKPNVTQFNLGLFKPVQLTSYYQALQDIGFNYGPNFRVIQQVLSHQNQYVAKIQINTQSSNDDIYFLDPRLLDGSLQTCLICLIDQGLLDKHSHWAYVPMMIEQFAFKKAIPEIAYVYLESVVAIKGMQDSYNFDLQIVDSENQLCVEINQVVFKKIKRETTSPKPQPVAEHKPFQLIKPTVEGLSNTKQKTQIISGKHEADFNHSKRKPIVNTQILSNKTTEYFINHIADIASLDQSEIDVKQPFKEYGIDSFLTLSIIRNLEDDFGELRKTLLFEASNIEELVALFVSEQKDTLMKMFHLDIPEVEKTEKQQDIDFDELEKSERTNINNPDLTSVFDTYEEKVFSDEVEIENSDMYQIIADESLADDPHVNEIVQKLLLSYGGETIALSRKDIAPYIFLCSKHQGLFYFNTHRNILLAFRYVGPDDYFLEAINELKEHCASSQLEMNVLCETNLEGLSQHGLVANSFGVVQRLTDIASFNTQGSKMRRLRYQVNKFQQSGDAKTFEYKVGSDVATDGAVARMIEKWAHLKSGVNPYIWRVKDEMETGTLGDEYRIFITYLDASLQNVIIISRIDSDNSYLLDTEFYSNEMAMGAMEFGIVEIINKLKEEGSVAFSLGLTFGASFIQSDQADPAVSQAFQKLAADQIFEESGNFQFKNKFRCDNAPLFLYRTANQTPANVIDVIMMIGNPQSTKPSSPVIESQNPVIGKVTDLAAHEVIHSDEVVDIKVKNQAKPKPVFKHNGFVDNEKILKSAQYNPFNLLPHDIEFDLATDSWSELEYSFIKERTELLQGTVHKTEAQLEDLITAVFGLPHVLPFSSGRVAESFFCPAWPKQKKYVLQNVLFPTCLFHQVNNDFIPVEIINSEFSNIHSNQIFKGDIDCNLLSKKLDEYKDDVAFIWIEIANNATGGCPVSINNLRAVKSIIGDIPLMIDATRIIENAYHIKSYESEFADQNIWTIVKEICSYADAVNASLTKDFGTHTGGFFATKDEELYAQLKDTISTNGSGLSRTDRQLVCHAVLDKHYILDAVKQRMNAVLQLAQILIDGGLSVVQPIGGHCILVDPMTIKELYELQSPLPAFLAWLYKYTGIRANIHSVGRQRNTPMNNLIRMAIPVGLTDDQVNTIGQRIVSLFNSNNLIDDLELKDKPSGLFGEMKANYLSKRQVQLKLSNDDNELVNDGINANIKEETVTVDKNSMTHNNQAMPQKGNQAVSQNDTQVNDIAVIGMGGRYPDAVNLEQFWHNLSQGHNSIKLGPDWAGRFIDANTPQHLGGFIDDVDKFDSLFFNISPREAKNMDPQERLVMEVSWEALEDAGYHPESLVTAIGSNQVGVFVGAVWSYYEMLGAENRQLGGDSIANSQHWGVSNRVSSFMNFSGPSLTVDTACSSSLTAMHLACESLRSGECKVALASGVNLDLHPSKYHITHAAQFLSEDGQCRAFGKGGSGYVAGEGVGTLVLKPLHQAELDGDHIYGVIKSTATNHGGRTAGYTVPSPNAQAELIAAAIKKAGITADTISYVEAHGTGTELGDPVEIQGATQAYREDTDAKQYCSIGSVKTNIGHLEAAAGIAGATKLLLQMKHKKLVASLHSRELNEYIDFASSPFYVQQENAYWQPLELNGKIIPRRAGLSSFGAGGTNVHIIFEEYSKAIRTPTSHHEQLLVVLSAKKEQGLYQQAKNLLTWLENDLNKNVNLAELVYTLQVGRLHMGKRLAVYFSDKGNLINGLRDYVDSKSNKNVYLADPNTKLALDIFDGEESAEIIEVLVKKGSFNKLAQFWVNGVDINWSQVSQNRVNKVSLPTYPFAKESHWISAIKSENNIERLNQSQSLTDKSSLKLHPLIDENISRAGHKEYRKQFTLDQFVFSDHIVDGIPTLPGVAYMEMARAAAAHASSYQVNTLRNLIWASPINSEGSHDIRIKLSALQDITTYEICTYDNSGKKHVHSQGKAVCVSQPMLSIPNKDISVIKDRCRGFMSKQACYDLLATRKLTYGAPLQTINGFHYGNKEGLTTLELPANLIASFNDYEAHPSILDGAVQSIISLLECVDTKTQAGVPYVPFVLSELLIHKPLSQNGYAHLVLDEGKKERDDIKKINIDIMNEQGEVLIQMKDFSFKAIAEQENTLALDSTSGMNHVSKHKDLVVYQPSWSPTNMLDRVVIGSSNETLVLFDNNLNNKEALNKEQLNQFGTIVLVGTHDSFLKIDQVHYQLNPTNAEHLQRLMDALLEDGLQPSSFVHNLGGHTFRSEEKAINSDLNNGLYALFSLSQSLLKNRKAIGVKSLSLTYLYHCQDDLTHPSNGAVNAFMRSIKHEGANIDCKTICINHESSNSKDLKVNWSLILQELQHKTDMDVMYKNGQRFCRALESMASVEKSTSKLNCELAKQGGVYLITGGMGGLGLIFAVHMLKIKGVKIILTGRSKANDMIDAKLNQLHGHTEYHSCDLTVDEDVDQLIKQILEKHGRLDGVIHAAGIIKDGFLWNKELSQFSSVLSPKISGTHHLDQATKEIDLDYFVLCSSIASVIGNMGQSDYAAGNRFMDEFATLRTQWQQQGLRKGRSVSINWPLWKSGGMQVNEQAEQWMFDNWGMRPLETSVGLEVLQFALSNELPVMGLVQGDVEKIHQALSIEANLPFKQENIAVKPVNTTINANVKSNASAPVENVRNEQLPMVDMLQKDLTAMVIELLKIKESDIEFTDNMSGYGFDSVTFTELANLINSQLEIDVTPLIFFEQETLEELTEYLLEDFAEPLNAHYERVVEIDDTVHESNDHVELDYTASESVSQDNQNDRANTQISEQTNEDIAIIGISGVMPQSADLDEFWQNLVGEKNLITEIPKDRWDWKKFYGESDLGNSKTEIKWGGFMPDVDKFDAEFFNISPLEAELTDPQQRVFLQSVWHAIEDAGYQTKELSGTNTGVFVGIGSSDYHELLREQSSDFEAYSVAGWMHAVLANRISYFFNWSGPSEPIGTACSSTLVAVDRAVRAIRSGQCDVCVAGGVSMLLNPGVHVGLGKASMLADDGRCKTFDHNANGYVRSEGVGALILKPLSKAQADGDRIHAVIKGTAVNHGGHVNTFTTPNPKAQADVLNMAFKDAKIDPATLTYIETHGTGTALGDPIEIQGLMKAFKNSANQTKQMPEISEYCTLGSVKTNAGHLELASGMSGIAKLILCLKNKVIPANINFEKINPYIKLENTPFKLASETKSWDQIPDLNNDLVPRRAGISSFGFGGVNAHLILEEYSEPKAPKTCEMNTVSQYPQVITLSAKYNEGLVLQAKQLIAYISKKDNENSLPTLETLAAGYQQGRDALSKRLALVVSTYHELLNALETYCNGNQLEHVFEGEKSTKNQISDEDVVKNMTAKDMSTLAQYWTAGKEIDWAVLNPRVEKITLPVYPFQKNRYWLLDNSYTGAVLDESEESGLIHELSDPGMQLLFKNELSETSTSVFAVLIDEDSQYINDHKIAGFKLLPAAGYLELVNHALCSTENLTAKTFRDVEWLEPVIIESINKGIHLKLIKNDSQYEFIFDSIIDGNHHIYCKGFVDTSVNEVAISSESFDFDRLQVNAKTHHEIYQKFKKAGFEYGVSLQIIDQMNVAYEREVFASLKLPEVFSNNISQDQFHCALLDGTLQGMLGVLLYQANEQSFQIPAHVKRIDWISPLAAKSFIHIKEIGQNLNQNKQIEARLFDIQIFDSSGQLSVRMDSFEIKNLGSQDHHVEINAGEGETYDLGQKELVKFLCQMIAEETKREYMDIDADTHFDQYGIDSFLALRMTKKLEKHIGPVNKTVFFEHKTVNDLAVYLAGASDSVMSSIESLGVNEEIISEPETQEIMSDQRSPMLDSTVSFLAQMIATETKRETSTIQTDASLDSLGIDSFLALRMTKKLEKIIGSVSKTMFFEHKSIDHLAEFLMTEHAESLQTHLNVLPVVEEGVEENAEVEAAKSPDSLLEQARDYLAEIIAVETKRDPSQIKYDESLDTYGVDSFLALRMTKKLEKVIGQIPKTVFFEHKTISALSQYLISEHTDSLIKEFEISSPKSNDDEVIMTSVKIDHAENGDLLAEKTRKYLAEIIAVETKRDPSQIMHDDSLDTYGVDSFLALRMTKKLEKVVGQIPKTVFFEHKNINDLSNYLIEVHQNELLSYFEIAIEQVNLEQDYVVSNQSNISANVVSRNEANTLGEASKTSDNIKVPIVIKETELINNPKVSDTVEMLFQEFGKENKALARNVIAPLLFIGSSSQAYFNFNIKDDVALAFTYVGADSHLVELVDEFTDYCHSQKLFTNMLIEQLVENTTENFSFNPFGMMQRLHDIKSMSLQGSKMRRLRYQINKFKQAGKCEFVEYVNGNNAETDKMIGEMIDQWAATKNMVNPYIWHVKDRINNGELDKQHRIFITYVEGVMQNVIIITQLASGTGYLMDLEFYSKDMPLGGLEYSIWQILQQLSIEDHDVFSLGATFGVINDAHVEADPDVTKVLTELQEQNAFDGQGNLQFKNKFRPENKTLYLARPIGDDPEKVIDVIMMIANPMIHVSEIT